MCRHRPSAGQRKSGSPPAPAPAHPQVPAPLRPGAEPPAGRLRQPGPLDRRPSRHRGHQPGRPRRRGSRAGEPGDAVHGERRRARRAADLVRGQPGHPRRRLRWPRRPRQHQGIPRGSQALTCGIGPGHRPRPVGRHGRAHRHRRPAPRGRLSQVRRAARHPPPTTARHEGASAPADIGETPMKMTGNTILVTGGTSGIGLGLALRFHQAGNKVIAAGRRKELLEQIAAEHDGIETLVLDVADPASIASAYETVSSRYPEANVLINMAGIMLPEDLHDSGFLPAAESTVTTNLLGPIRMLAAFIPFLAQQKDAAVINVSSGLAFVWLPITPTYNATKAAIHSFTESLRVQLADTPVQVLELIPPAVRTALLGQQDSEQAMPLDDFLSEVMTILQTQPDVEQIIVDNVKFLRFAEVGGTYDKVLSLLSGTDHA